MRYANYITENYLTKTYAQIADELNTNKEKDDPVLTRDMVVDYARRLKLPKKLGSKEPMKVKKQDQDKS